MEENKLTQKIRGYCDQCYWRCPTVSYVEKGKFVAVKPDEEHPFASPLCPKGLAGPELVYNNHRLKYPMRRTKPKGAPDPGWERITWDDALDTIAAKLNKIKAEFGSEAVVISQSFGGSALLMKMPWIMRLANAFRTPNCLTTTHICNWHRDACAAYTFAQQRMLLTAGTPQYEESRCLLIWGNNPHATCTNSIPPIERALRKGAKLIVVDPRKTRIAAVADVWLQVKPGTDGALALGMIREMIEDKLYDHDFVQDWTTAPFLVRSDDKNFLRPSDLDAKGPFRAYVVVDSATNSTKEYTSGTESSVEPALDAAVNVKLTSGEQVECKTVFRLLREAVSEYTLSRVEKLTRVPGSKVRDAVRTFAGNKPACWFSYNGVEQNINASQTSRAVCILYALTGDYDKPGGNAVLPAAPMAPQLEIAGMQFLGVDKMAKCLGLGEYSLGCGGTSLQTQPYIFYKAILTGKPYPIKALLSFGGNYLDTNPPSQMAREAHIKLGFHVQCDLFLTPTAEMADIVLPVASSWETWYATPPFSKTTNFFGADAHANTTKAIFQFRPAVVPPQHESWSDMTIIFELAKRLGLGDKFWNGDVEAAFNYLLAPSGMTIDRLRNSPGGIFIDLPMEYQKYKKKDTSGNFLGFPTPSRRVEIYSKLFKDRGYDPLPVWRDPYAIFLPHKDLAEKYPLILTNSKLAEYCHSQHRALPSLRRRAPHPFLEINPSKARELDIKDGDRIVLETPNASITLQAKLTDGVQHDVVCTQHGWWQDCPELDLPSYDPYSPEGANVNLLYTSEERDPISGSLHIKGYPCNVRRK